MNIIATTSDITAAHVAAFLDFIAPSEGQVIALPTLGGKVLLNFTDDGEKRVAWLPQSATPSAQNVQTMRLVHLEPHELAAVKDVCHNPQRAKVLGHC